MKDIAIIGAGVSGLAAATLLKRKGYNVDIYEKNNFIGGIARTKLVEGCPYHLTGGHCFNSKHQSVLDFVFDLIPLDKWNKIERKSKIIFENGSVDYPIELHLSQLDKIMPGTGSKSILEIASSDSLKEPKNLEEWFIAGFGKTLTDLYFTPYNRKIWGQEPSSMDFDWVIDKLPNPDKEQIVNSLFKEERDKMPHSYFYYPKSGNQFDLIEKLSNNQNIKFNCNINQLTVKNNKWIVNDKKYDKVITTAPLNQINNLISDIPSHIAESANKLKYNSVTNMIWEAKKTEETWTYHPSKNTVFHRHIHIGNFLKPNKNFVITEAIGKVNKDIMIKEGKKYEYLVKPLDYNLSDHAYVVFDENYKECREALISYFDEKGIYTLGRFGEWEYYNMDICIKSAMNLVKKAF